MKLINGPEAFTPDGEFILGPTEVRGLWTAAGFCAHGLAGAGGMGQLVAEWIVEGVPSLDAWHMDSRRFGRAYRSPRLHARPHARGLRDLLRREVPGPRAAGRPAAAALADVPPARRARRGVRREVGLGARELVRAERRPRRRVAAAARLGGAALVARDRRRAPRLPRDGGALRRDVVRQDRGVGRGRRGAPRAPLREPRRPRRRRDHLHPDAERARRDRVRLHRHAARRRAVPDRHRAPRSASTTSPGSASTRPTASPSRTSPRRTPASGCGARARARSSSR